MKISLFNGGLNTRQDPTLIAPNEAVECENVDTSTGLLKSSLDKTATTQQITNTPYYWERESEWQDRAGSLEYMEYQDRLYWTTTGMPQKYDGTTVKDLGIVAPSAKPTVALANPEVPLFLTDTAAEFNYTFDVDVEYLESGTNGLGVPSAIISDAKDFPALGIVENDYIWFNTASEPYFVSSFPSVSQIVFKDADNVDVVTNVVPSNAPYTIGRINSVASGTTDAAGMVANQLIDTSRSVNFIDAGVVAGMYVSNDTTASTDSLCFVDTVSETILTLVDSTGASVDYFSTGSEDYKIGTIAGTYNYQLVLTNTNGAEIHFETQSATTIRGQQVTCEVTINSALSNIASGVVNTLLDYSDFTTDTFDAGITTVPYTGIQPSILPAVGATITFGVSTIANGIVSVPIDLEVTAVANTDGGVQIITLNSNTAVSGATLNFYYKVGTYYYLIQSSTAKTVDFDGSLVLADLDIWETSGLTGTYQYVYTYYNSTEGIESAPSPLSLEIEAEQSFVNISDLAAPADTDSDYIRIYRVGGSLSNFFLVVEQLVSAGTTYQDISADSSLGDLLDSILNKLPPTGLRYLKSVYGLFVGSVEDKFYFTRDIGNPNYWPDTYYIDFDNTITGIGLTASNIVVFTKYKAFALLGSSANTFSKQPLSGDQGCINHATIVEYGGQIIFVSTDGICITSGTTVEVVSKFKLGKQVLSTVNACIHDETYYLQLTDNSILAFDFRYEPSIKTFDFGTDYVLTALDTLYARRDSDNYMCTMFDGDPVALTYKTGKLSEGAVSVLKAYNKIYVKTEATTQSFVIKVYIDGTLRLTQTLTGSLLYEVTPPQTYQQGYDIQYEITGTGTIQEIEYKAVGRANGR